MFMSQKRLSFQSMFTKIFLLNMMCTIYYINAEWFFYNTLYIYIYIYISGIITKTDFFVFIKEAN